MKSFSLKLTPRILSNSVTKDDILSVTGGGGGNYDQKNSQMKTLKSAGRKIKRTFSSIRQFDDIQEKEQIGSLKKYNSTSNMKRNTLFSLLHTPRSSNNGKRSSKSSTGNSDEDQTSDDEYSDEDIDNHQDTTNKPKYKTYDELFNSYYRNIVIFAPKESSRLTPMNESIFHDGDRGGDGNWFNSDILYPLLVNDMMSQYQSEEKKLKTLEDIYYMGKIGEYMKNTTNISIVLELLLYFVNSGDNVSSDAILDIIRGSNEIRLMELLEHVVDGNYFSEIKNKYRKRQKDIKMMSITDSKYIGRIGMKLKLKLLSYVLCNYADHTPSQQVHYGYLNENVDAIVLIRIIRMCCVQLATVTNLEYVNYILLHSIPFIIELNIDHKIISSCCSAILKLMNNSHANASKPTWSLVMNISEYSTYSSNILFTLIILSDIIRNTPGEEHLWHTDTFCLMHRIMNDDKVTFVSWKLQSVIFLSTFVSRAQFHQNITDDKHHSASHDYYERDSEESKCKMRRQSKPKIDVLGLIGEIANEMIELFYCMLGDKDVACITTKDVILNTVDDVGDGSSRGGAQNFIHIMKQHTRTTHVPDNMIIVHMCIRILLDMYNDDAQQKNYHYVRVSVMGKLTQCTLDIIMSRMQGDNIRECESVINIIHDLVFTQGSMMTMGDDQYNMLLLKKWILGVECKLKHPRLDVGVKNYLVELLARLLAVGFRFCKQIELPRTHKTFLFDADQMMKCDGTGSEGECIKTLVCELNEMFGAMCDCTLGCVSVAQDIRDDGTISEIDGESMHRTNQMYVDVNRIFMARLIFLMDSTTSVDGVSVEWVFNDDAVSHYVKNMLWRPLDVLKTTVCGFRDTYAEYIEECIHLSKWSVGSEESPIFETDKNDVKSQGDQWHYVREIYNGAKDNTKCENTPVIELDSSDSDSDCGNCSDETFDFSPIDTYVSNNAIIFCTSVMNILFIIEHAENKSQHIKQERIITNYNTKLLEICEILYEYLESRRESMSVRGVEYHMDYVLMEMVCLIVIGHSVKHKSTFHRRLSLMEYIHGYKIVCSTILAKCQQHPCHTILLKKLDSCFDIFNL